MIPKTALVSWLFATWWLYVAIRDCTNPKSPRYGNLPSILFALIAAGTLGWLGFLLMKGARDQILICLISFAVSFVLWVIVSLAGGRRQ